MVEPIIDPKALSLIDLWLLFAFLSVVLCVYLINGGDR